MKDFFNKFHKLDPEILEVYLSQWTELQAPKKTILTAPGETERYMYFVLEGVQKSYYLNEDKQHIIAFTYPPSLSGIPESFLSQSPSKYYLETVTDSRFWRIPFRKHQEMMAAHREIETLFRKTTEALLMGLMHRHYELMALDINQRFKSFAQRSPHLFQLVAQKDLASYLRIDPTNFSKLFNSVKI